MRTLTLVMVSYEDTDVSDGVYVSTNNARADLLSVNKDSWAKRLFLTNVKGTSLRMS